MHLNKAKKYQSTPVLFAQRGGGGMPHYIEKTLDKNLAISNNYLDSES